MLDFIASILGISSAELAKNAGGILGGFSFDHAIQGVVIYLLVIWVAFIIWVVRDITNRTSNLFFQTFAILVIVAFTPILGLPIYFLVRPRATLFEQYYEELEMAEAEHEEGRRCGACGGVVELDHRYCPYCADELLIPCKHCKGLVRKEWEHCVHCGKEIDHHAIKSNSKEIQGVEKSSKKSKETKEEKIENSVSEKITETTTSKENSTIEAVVNTEIEINKKTENSPSEESPVKKKHSIVAEEL